MVLIGADRPNENGAIALSKAVLEIPFLTRMLVRAAPADALPATHPAQEKLKAATSAAAFICVGKTCSLPVITADDIEAAVDRMRPSSPSP